MAAKQPKERKGNWFSRTSSTSIGRSSATKEGWSKSLSPWSLFQNLVAANVITRQFQIFAPTNVGGYRVLKEPLCSWRSFAALSTVGFRLDGYLVSWAGSKPGGKGDTILARSSGGVRTVGGNGGIRPRLTFS